MTDLKPCPFCGGGEQFAPAVLREAINHAYVKCSFCEARTRRFKNPRDAIYAWNRRTKE